MLLVLYSTQLRRAPFKPTPWSTSRALQVTVCSFRNNKTYLVQSIALISKFENKASLYFHHIININIIVVFAWRYILKHNGHGSLSFIRVCTWKNLLKDLLTAKGNRGRRVARRVMTTSRTIRCVRCWGCEQSWDECHAVDKRQGQTNKFAMKYCDHSLIFLFWNQGN